MYKRQTVASSAALNYYTTPTFSIGVKVIDNGAPALSQTATITITIQPGINQPPLISDQTFSVSQNAPSGTSVGPVSYTHLDVYKRQLAGTVAASDPDAGQTKTFSIVSGNTNGAFAINASTGAITVASSAALNFESTPSFPLVIKVQDNGCLLYTSRCV